MELHDRYEKRIAHLEREAADLRKWQGEMTDAIRTLTDDTRKLTNDTASQNVVLKKQDETLANLDLAIRGDKNTPGIYGQLLRINLIEGRREKVFGRLIGLMCSVMAGAIVAGIGYVIHHIH